MILIRIDRSTIRKNPNAGRTEFEIPGRPYMEGGKEIIPLQVVKCMTPEPSFWYDYSKTNVQCSQCNAVFDANEFEDYAEHDRYVDALDARICPKCGAWECCGKIEKEALTQEMINEMGSRMNRYEVVKTLRDSIATSIGTSRVETKVVEAHSARDALTMCGAGTEKNRDAAGPIYFFSVKYLPDGSSEAGRLEALNFDEVIKNIEAALEGMNGFDVVMAHNSICGKKIRYDGNSVWEYTGEDDNA